MEGKEGLRSSNVCPTCGKEVEIYNDDLCFSMSLHMGAHKPLEAINLETEEQPKKGQFVSNDMNTVNNNFCPEYQSNERSFNNGLNSINKNSGNMYRFTEAKRNLASSSRIGKTSKERSKDIEPQPIYQASSFSSLEEVFNFIESKLHRGFFSENSGDVAFCKICNVTVQPIIIIEHLRTRLHENNTIRFLTSLLPDELHHIMEFVSFSSSSLFCSLCELKIDSCSTNPNEAILSITLHNLSKGHLDKKESDQFNSAFREGSIILKSLAKENPLINNLVDFKLNAQFKCKLCKKVIKEDFINKERLNSLLNNHFLSKTHLKCLAHSELMAYKNKRDIVGKGEHHFSFADHTIYCTVCEMFVEPKPEALTLHVTRPPCVEMLLSPEVNMPTTSHISTTNNQTIVPEKVTQGTTTILSFTTNHINTTNYQPTEPKKVDSETTNMLGSPNAPEQLRNTDCVAENDIGELVFKIIIVIFLYLILGPDKN